MKPYLPTTFIAHSTEQITALAPIADVALRIKSQSNLLSQTIHINMNRMHLPAERFNHVLKKCSALQTIVEQAKTSQLGHDAGFALVWMVLQFENAMAWIQQNMLGWAQTEADQQQILNSVHYAPLSCQTMQQKGLCKFTRPDACLKIKAATGKTVSPSPIRFAYSSENHEDQLREILTKLQGTQHV